VAGLAKTKHCNFAELVVLEGYEKQFPPIFRDSSGVSSLYDGRWWVLREGSMKRFLTTLIILLVVIVAGLTTL
ncbi:hypothetical protein CGH73_25720, partial [Vibrio parahaemolyticus]|uniref:hypothetical protein n=1 Tax=Vibrio parahaemolyticus TaxID=670 RepID=UPI00116C34BA